MRYPEKIIIDITGRCNLRCRYCCFFSNPSESGFGELTTAQWLNFIQDASRCGVMEIGLRGGEALLRDDLPELIAAIVGGRMRYTLLTNGLRMTPEIADMLAASRRCNMLKISLDGAEADHDPVRGAGSHAAALEAIRLVRERGLPLVVTCAVHKRNWRRLPEIGRYFFEELDLPLVTFSAVYECEAKEDWGLTFAEFDAMIELVAQLRGRYGDRLLSRGVVAVLDHWRRIQNPETACARRQSGFCGCSSVARALYVRSDGCCMFCPTIGGDERFHILREDLETIWTRSREWRERQMAGVDVERYSECRNCRFRAGCAGACMAIAWHNRPWESITCLRRHLNQVGRN